MNPNARNAYLASSVTTASPARLLVMLCERLVLDIERGLQAQQAAAFAGAHTQLIHAPALLTELTTSLRPDGWEGAASLTPLHHHMSRTLLPPTPPPPPP